MDAFVTAQHAAEMVGLAVYARAVLGRSMADEPGVVSLRIECTHTDPGLSVIECELIGPAGMAVAGWSL